MSESRLSLELAEDCVLVCEKVPEQANIVLLVHTKTSLLLRSHDAWCKGGAQALNIAVVCAGELDESSEVGDQSIQCSNIGKSQLSQSRLNDLYLGAL